MNRITVTATCIAVCAALLLPSAALAKKKDYLGAVQPSGEIAMTLKKSKSGKKSILNLDWDQVPVTCKGGTQKTSSGAFTFKVPVKQNEFTGRGVLGNPNNPDARAVIKGKIKTAKKIKGNIRLDGKKLPVDQGGTDNCDSERLRWKATT